MRRLILAFRAFFRTLGSAATADQVARALTSTGLPSSAPKPADTLKPVVEKKPTRSDALTLLATLQREARFVDLVQEPLDGYSDAQIGAAARDVLRDSRSVLQRLFAMKPLVSQAEGESIEVPAGYDAGRFRITGQVSSQPPHRGRLVHPGWEATTCDMPIWSGTAAAAKVIATAEVEIG